MSGTATCAPFSFLLNSLGLHFRESEIVFGLMSGPFTSVISTEPAMPLS